MFPLLRSLLRHKRLLKDFVVRDLKARYVGSSMGFFWSVVFPVINLFVYMFVFRLVLNARWSDSQGALEVAIVMLAGIVVWTAFAETISRSTNCLVDNANLIQKVVFPAEVLPSYLTFSSLINMCIGLPVVLGAVFWFGHVSPPEGYIRVPHETVDVNGEPTSRPKVVRIGEWAPKEHERDGAAHSLVVPIEVTRGWRKRLRIPFRLSGTATRGVDYSMPDDEIVIPPGELQGLLVIVPHADDDVEEGDETIVLELDPSGDVPIMAPGDPVFLGRPLLEITVVDTPLAITLPDGRTVEQGTDARIEGIAGTHIPPKPPRKPHEVREEYHPLSLGKAIVALPLLFVLQVVFTVGVGYFLAAFNLFLRDTFHVVGVAVTVWMFATPIFYPGHLVQKAGFGWMLWINPMHWLIDSYRRVLVFGVWPQPLDLCMLLVASILTFFLGGRFFMNHRAKFPDLL